MHNKKAFREMILFNRVNWFFVFCLINSCLSLAEFDKNSVSINVESNWENPSFQLQLLETISEYNSSLYISSVSKILQLDLSEEEEGGELDLDAAILKLSDKQYYEAVKSLLENKTADESYFDIYLANNFYSPRIVSHYSYYAEHVLPKFEQRLLSCSSDFDTIEEKQTRNLGLIPRAWIFYNGDVLCNPKDIFALKTDLNNQGEEQLSSLLPFDRVIGINNEDAPLVILYGDESDPNTREFFHYLYESTKLGKLKFVWRYIGPTSSEKQALGGFGVDLTLKRTDYIVIDDRDIKAEPSSIRNLDGKNNEQKILNNDVDEQESGDALNFLNKTYKNINGVSKSKLKNLDLKLSNYILNDASLDSFGKFELLKEIVGNFPKYAFDIATSAAFKFNKTEEKFKGLLKNIRYNNKNGLTKEMKGIYMNGKLLSPSKYNIYDFMKSIKEESALVKKLCSLNLLPIAAKGFISEFSKLSAIALTKMTGTENLKRYNIRDAIEKYPNSSVIFFNDIEKDPEYKQYLTSRNVFMRESKAKAMGEIPNYKENLFDVIFVVNLSNKMLASIISKIISTVKQQKIGHRVGIIPITLKETDRHYNYVNGETFSVNNQDIHLSSYEDYLKLDQLLISDFYKQTKEPGFDIINYLEGIGTKYYSKLWEKYLVSPEKYTGNENSQFVSQFDLDQNYVIVDGVLYPFSIYDQTWQRFIYNQLNQDINLVSHLLLSGRIPMDKSEDNHKKIADYIYELSSPIRDILITPQTQHEIQYIKINSDFITQLNHNDHHFSFAEHFNGEQNMNRYYSYYVIGNFNTDSMRLQLLESLKLLQNTKRDYLLKYRLINTNTDNTVLEKFKMVFDQDIPLSQKIMEIYKYLQADSLSNGSIDAEKSIMDILSINEIAINEDPVIILNSRIIEINDGRTVMNELSLDSLIKNEADTRLFKELYAIVEDFEKEHRFISKLQIDRFDWSDLFFSHLTNMYYGSSIPYEENAPRLQLSSLAMNNVSFSLSSDPELCRNVSLVDITVIIDPLEEMSQKILFMLDSLSEITRNSFEINLSIMLVPAITLEEVPIKRFYNGVYLSRVQFDSKNEKLDRSIYNVNFKNVPQETLFTSDLDIPHSWIALAKESKYDLDNIKLDLTEEEYVKGTYELNNIIIEGYSEVANSELLPNGIQLELLKSEADILKVYSDTSVMANFGYFQLKANPGIWDLRIKPKSKSYKVFGFSDSFDLNGDLHENIEYVDNHKLHLALMTMDGIIFQQKFEKNAKFAHVSLIRDNNRQDHRLYDGDSSFIGEDESEADSNIGWFEKLKSLIIGNNEEKIGKQADINIMAVASGHLYERLLSIMTASVRNHTEHSVKFWLIDNYMSANFRAFLPELARKYKFEYELVTYKWPIWLREQREKQRTIWGYKILFLDVLFPQNLEKVIFVDADQIVRTDLQELVDLDLEGAPYGYTPMCDSRTEMEGFRFWKKGYWKSVLSRSGLKYHISALYVVDLVKFRSIAAGDVLRRHYQSLSADPNSLSNLDQDLPNNIQHILPIHSLPQEWLWCETWCSDESLKDAKTIDLCNNPLTKEPKLDRARRQIPEWNQYDHDIGELMRVFKSKQETIMADETSDVPVEVTLEIKNQTDGTGENLRDEL